MTETTINQLRLTKITELLTQSLSPSELTVEDESHLHAGHEGAKTGKGHFYVKIKSQQLSGLTPVKKHQLIYQSLGDLMQTDIHALRITTSR